MGSTENDIFTERLVVLEEIPEKKLSKINALFALAEGEEIDSFIDDTIMNNGKKGILFTNRGIHWKLIMEKGFIHYCDITDLDYQQKKKNINILVNGKKLEVITAEFDKEEISNHINDCIDEYKEISTQFPAKNLKIKKVTSPKVGFFSRLFIIELPYIFVGLGIAEYYNENTLFTNIDYSYLLLGGAVLLLLTLPYRIKKGNARKKVGKRQIISLTMHVLLILLLLFWDSFKKHWNEASSNTTTSKKSTARSGISSSNNSSYSKQNKMISDVQEKDAWIVVYDQNGKENKRMGLHNRTVVGVTSGFFVVEDGAWIVTYDIDCKEIKRMGKHDRIVRGASGNSFIVKDGVWTVTYDKNCKEINRRGH